MSNAEHFRKLERMYASAPTNEYYAPKLHIGERRAELTIPVRPDFFPAAVAAHGAGPSTPLDDSPSLHVHSLGEAVMLRTVSLHG